MRGAESVQVQRSMLAGIRTGYVQQLLLSINFIIIDLMHFQFGGVLINHNLNNIYFDQVLTLIQRCIGNDLRFFIHPEVILSGLLKGNIIKADRIIRRRIISRTLHGLDTIPENLLLFILTGKLGQSGIVFIIGHLRNKFFNDKPVLLFFSRLVSVNRFSKAQISVHTQQRGTLVGIQVAFTGGPDFITHHTAAVVTALDIDISLWRDDVAEFRGDFVRHVNPLRVRIVPQKGHTLAVFDCNKGIAVDRDLRCGIGSTSQVIDDRGRDSAVVIGHDVFPLTVFINPAGNLRELTRCPVFIQNNDIDGDYRVLGIIDGHIGTGIDVIFHRRDLGVGIIPGLAKGIGGVKHHILQAFPVDIIIADNGVACIGARISVTADRAAPVNVIIADNRIDGTDIRVPSIIIVLPAVKERISGQRNISANNGRLFDRAAVRNACACDANDISANQYAAHLVLFHQEVAVAESAGSAVTGTGNIVRAQCNNIVSVQDLLKGISCKLVSILFEFDCVINVKEVFILCQDLLTTLTGTVRFNRGIADYLERVIVIIEFNLLAVSRLVVGSVGDLCGDFLFVPCKALLSRSGRITVLVFPFSDRDINIGTAVFFIDCHIFIAFVCVAEGNISIGLCRTVMFHGHFGIGAAVQIDLVRIRCIKL